MSQKHNSRAPMFLVGLLVVLVGAWAVMIFAPSDAFGLGNGQLSMKENFVILLGVAVALMMYWDTRRHMRG